MTCEYGTRRKQNSVDFINPNDIGVLCFLFGLEGGLCRILDLIPNAIKKIAALDPTKGNSDEIFGKLLKKVAKTSYGLVIDELTNQISTNQLCGSEPPIPTEDINFSDIFVFIAELVPILEKFFTVNEILSGNSTKILEKIVNTWLRGKWFENCECKPKDPDAPPPSTPDLPSQPPPFFPLADCPSDDPNDPNNRKKRSKRLQLTNVDPVTGNSTSGCRGGTIYGPQGCGGSLISSGYGFVKIKNEFDAPIWVAQEFKSTDPDRFLTWLPYGNGYSYLTFDALIINPYIRFWYRQGGGPWLPFGGDPSVFDGLPFEPCPEPNPKPIPPDSFCGLYPEDPICLPFPEQDCEVANYAVSVKVDCSTKIRKPVARVLRIVGVDESITVQEFSVCGERTTKTVKLLKCAIPVSGCTDPTSLNYNPDANVDDGSCVASCEAQKPALVAYANDLAAYGTTYDGYDRPYRIDDLGRAYGAFKNTDIYRRSSTCDADFMIWFADAWNNYFNPPTSGCMDPSAWNYNPDANIDDGSCEY